MHLFTKNKKYQSVISIVLFSALFLFPAASFTQSGSDIKIDIGKAKTKKSLLAFPPLQYFGSATSASKFQAVGAEIYSVVTNDLTVSSFFQFIPQSAYLEDTSKTSLKPAPVDANGFKFQSWASIGTDFLIRAGFSILDNEITIDTYTYQVSKGQLVLGKKYKAPIGSARKIAHTFANDLLQILTGQEGMFLSKVVVGSDRAGGKAREIFVMDWDGSNVKQISSHSSIALSPAWSKDGRKIAYTAYVQKQKGKGRNADMLIYDTVTARRTLISYRQGMNSGASFSPDGQFIYLTISQGTSPDIYKMNLDGTIVAKLTSGPNAALNVEPAASPDGKYLAFSSDRAGRPMIYTMNVDGSTVKRITFAGQFNSSPAWSPDSKKLAFAGQSDDHFDIFVMNVDGSNMIRLTSAKKSNGRWANNEDPSFSPDGRFVMYISNRTGKSQIYISTVDGNEERRVTNDNYNYYRPKWSANLP
ncbi:MAG: translocation protein TolB [Pseudobdellovibrionaceae bacterium]